MWMEEHVDTQRSGKKKERVGRRKDEWMGGEV